MSFDNDLKQAFERHAADVSPTPGAWSGVERRVRRSHRVRAALATAGSAAAIVVAVVVGPSLLTNKPASPPDIPPATELPGTAGEKATFRNERDGYWLQYPKAWRFGEFEAHVSFQPPGVPGIVEGGETFAVDIWLDAGRYDDPERLGTLEGSNPVDQPRDTTVAGRNAKEKEYIQRDGAKTAHSVTYFVDWTGYSCPANAPCPGVPSVLIVNIQATPSEKPLWDTYGDAAKAILISIQLNNASTMPANTVVSTRRGSVGTNVEYDETTASVVRFMEARIETGGAEPFLTSNAKQQYDSREGGLSLYSPDERTSYISYKIVARDQADANSWEFIVEISTVTPSATGPEARTTFRETLGVGPSGGSPAMIRFAVRDPHTTFVDTPAQR